jgi:serine/threonine protein kinase
LGDQILDAIEYLHNQVPPIIHRDIKPANIRITPQGMAVLVDFGLAKIYDPTDKTTEGIRAVTSGYSPIEQYSSRLTDVRTDIYALGATLYTLLTGQVIHESVLRYIDDPVKPPNQLNPALSDAVSFAIQRAIAIDPSQRWQSAAEFKAALHNQAIPELQPSDERGDLSAESFSVIQADDQASPGEFVLSGSKMQTIHSGSARSLALMAAVALLVFCLIGALSGLYLLDPFDWLSVYSSGGDTMTVGILATQFAAASPVNGSDPNGSALDTLVAGTSEDGGKLRIGLLAPLSGAVPSYGLSSKEARSGREGMECQRRFIGQKS